LHPFINLRIVRGVVVLLSGFVLMAFAQERPAEIVKVEAPVYFSGNVTQASAVSITVNRKGLGSNAATKTFVIDRETKIEGKLRSKVKVTVRFVMDEAERARAVRIIVR
jgi:hypothetical protein